jgi:large subunit ribosomal protein L6
MSRVAKCPIKMPAGVSITVDGQEVSIKGGKGLLSCLLHPLVSIHYDSNEICLSPKDLNPSSDMQAATARAVLNNFVVGVSEGFVIKLILVGVGYRAQVQGKKLNMTLGFSHPINHDIPEGIVIETPSQTEILVKGIDKQLVGQVASNIRSYRPPEPYKGKGVRYEKEKIILKETKKK